MKTLLGLLFLNLFMSGCASAVQSGDAVQAAPELNAETSKVPVAASEPPLPIPTEWKGVCRKTVNETGKQIGNGADTRLQSSYVFSEKETTWFVKTFKDKKCRELAGGNKFSFSCDSDPSVRSARCLQKTIETWDGMKWRSEKMVDHAGFPNQLEMQYSLKAGTGNKATLKSRSISDGADEETSEPLSR